jgi:Flp pilus assembly protein TadB
VPLLVDLVTVALGAGTTPALAVTRVAPWAPPTLRDDCVRLADAPARGQRFVAACAEGARRQPALAPLLDALALASVEGGAVTPTLTRLAASARDDARRAAEVRARAVPVRLLFPLVLTVLPAFVLLTVAPVVFGVLAGR